MPRPPGGQTQHLTLTKDLVDTLPALNGKRTYYVDTIVPELELIVQPSGDATWAVRIQQKGRPLDRERLGKARGPRALPWKGVRDAARALVNLRQIKGEPKPVSVADRPTVGAICAAMMAQLDLKESTREGWQGHIDREIRPLAECDATALKRSEVRAWVKSIPKRSMAQHAFEVLRRAYSHALDEDSDGLLVGLLPASPCAGLGKLFPKAEPAPRDFSIEEVRWLLGAVCRIRWADSRRWARELGAEDPEWFLGGYHKYADATLLLLLTGVRRANVLGMRRADLRDLDRPDSALWLIPAGKMKGRRGRTSELRVPLSPWAVEIVKRRLALIDAAHGKAFQHLFPVGAKKDGEDRPMTWARKWVRTLREELPPVPHWTFHDFRDTASTLMVKNCGVRAEIASLILSHKPEGIPRISLRYIRLRDEAEIRAALNRWAAWLESLQQVAPGEVAAQPAKILRMTG